jgi:excisionase family DNA binding protein
VPAAAAGPEVLTPGDVAKVLGVAEADVVAAIEAGDLKGKKIGSAYRITRGALDEFLKH